MADWSLFIDESGPFENPGADPVVAGVLVPGDLPRSLASQLRMAVRQAVPFAPWPLHAWLTRRLPMHALWAFLSGEPLHPLVERALAAALRLERETLEESLERLRAGREPVADHLAALERAIRSGTPDAAAYLWQRAVETRAAIARAVGAFAAEVASAGGALLLAAGESRRGDAVPDPEIGGDRYLTLLEPLLQRAALVAAERGGDHVVRITALGRRVAIRDVPGARRDPPLGPRHLARAASAATGPDRTLRRASATVRLVPWRVASFGPDVDPLFVAADFAANVARRHLPRARPLGKLVLALERRVGLPSWTAERRLPGPAASGAARQILDRALAGEPPAQPPPAGIRPWAHEQALAWATAVTGRQEEEP